MVSDDPATQRSARGNAVRYVFWARALRDFGDGFVAVLLPVYLIALGFSPLQVGVIATAALLGSALLTLGVGLVGARYDYRRLLLAAANLMIATGVAFALVHDFALLAVVAFAGTVNPSAGSVSVFVPLEHAVLSRDVADHERTKMFARYSLIGAHGRGLRRACRRGAGFPGGNRPQSTRWHSADVRALRRAGCRRRIGLLAYSASPATDRRGAALGAGAVPAHRLQAGRFIQP